MVPVQEEAVLIRRTGVVDEDQVATAQHPELDLAVGVLERDGRRMPCDRLVHAQHKLVNALDIAGLEPADALRLGRPDESIDLLALGGELDEWALERLAGRRRLGQSDSASVVVPASRRRKTDAPGGSALRKTTCRGTM